MRILRAIAKRYNPLEKAVLRLLIALWHNTIVFSTRSFFNKIDPFSDIPNKS
jgi:hypothetical protein